MSEELKPCPFCGGEAAMESGRYELDDGMYAFAHVECLSCGACGSGFTEADSPVEMVGHLASEAWNRRAERTCRVEVERRKLSQTQTAIVKTCSGCGSEFGVEKENTLPFEVTLNVVVPPNYCPNCGARVEVER